MFFFPPFRTRTEDSYMHRFSLPGVLFVLEISKTFTEGSKDGCIMHSAGKTIYHSQFTDQLVDRDSINLMRFSQISIKLKTEYNTSK